MLQLWDKRFSTCVARSRSLLPSFIIPKLSRQRLRTRRKRNKDAAPKRKEKEKIITNHSGDAYINVGGRGGGGDDIFAVAAALLDASQCQPFTRAHTSIPCEPSPVHPVFLSRFVPFLPARSVSHFIPFALRIIFPTRHPPIVIFPFANGFPLSLRLPAF